MFTRRSLVPIAAFGLTELVLVTGVGHWLAARGTLPPVSLAVLAALLHVGAGYYGHSVGASGWFCGAMVSTIGGAASAAVQILFGASDFRSVPPAMGAVVVVGGVLVPFLFGAVEGFVGGLIAGAQSPTTPGTVA